MYVSVIIDIAHQSVDRPFTYRVPEALRDRIALGTAVRVPFGAGNSIRRGYVTDIRDQAPEGINTKDILEIDEKAVGIEEDLIRLAIWMRYRYGGTLYQAMSVVLPNKMKVEPKRTRFFTWTGTDEELRERLDLAMRKKHYARIRLLTAFQDQKTIPASIAAERLQIGADVVKKFAEEGLVRIDVPEERGLEEKLREALENYKKSGVELNTEQKAAADGILKDGRTAHILYGVTGSGKTEVYLSLIRETLQAGKEAIVLIPEIALTFQTVMRFYERFGDLVSVVHSRISKGDRSLRFRLAKEGRVRVMIGPRSALFTPFKNLGLIVVDEFHERSYHSEQVPRYDAVETALKRAEDCGAKVVLGSATPSVEWYDRALNGELGLFRLHARAVPGAELPEVEVADMREELRAGNRSVFSRTLREKIAERLVRGEQTMLFLNRRGYSGAVSCRMCGKPVTCPHCSVSLNYHRDGTLRCHICGYSRPHVKTCPSCGSDKIGTFGIGTEKVEEMVKEAFPGVRTLRMDADTTAGRDGHREILEKFMNREADVLVGTQMIVKGHDFPNVTLVGILAADLSLNVPDYRRAENTCQLLTQAEGRAGRGARRGACVVQTYLPEHYAVEAAVQQDYEAFFRAEKVFRRQMHYPPAASFLMMTVSGAREDEVLRVIDALYRTVADDPAYSDVELLGPVEAGVYKVKDQYRRVLYLKCAALSTLLLAKRSLEERTPDLTKDNRVFVTFES